MDFRSLANARSLVGSRPHPHNALARRGKCAGARAPWPLGWGFAPPLWPGATPPAAGAPRPAPFVARAPPPRRAPFPASRGPLGRAPPRSGRPFRRPVLRPRCWRGRPRSPWSWGLRPRPVASPAWLLPAAARVPRRQTKKRSNQKIKRMATAAAK